MQIEHFSNVAPADVLSVLERWVAGQAQAVGSKHIAVRWPQLSIVFCSRKNPLPPQPTDILYFHDRRTDSMQTLPLAEEFHCREHILFVEYELQFRELLIYGDLSCADYTALLEFGFVTLADVQQQPPRLCYRLSTLEQESLSALRTLLPYYEPAAAQAHPLDNICHLYSLGELADHFDSVISDVAGLSAWSNQKLANAAPDALAKQLFERLLLNHTDAPFRFRCGLLLSALHPRFAAEFVVYEQTLLRLRLELCYSSELQRSAYVRRWFPALLREIRPLRVAHQFYGLPEEARRPYPPDDERVYAELAQQRDCLAPDGAAAPYPSTVFVVPLEHATNLLAGARSGTVELCHYALAECCASYVGDFVRAQVVYLQRAFGFAFARSLWTRLILRHTHYQLTEADSQRLLLEELNTVKDTEALEHMLESVKASTRFGVFSRYLLPTVASFDGYYGQRYYEPFQAWPDPAHGRLPPKIRQQDVDAGVDSLLPQNYDELLQYAHERWPPCMQSLVEISAKTHLRHGQRVAMSALLRCFEYSTEEGEHLWSVLFSQTEVYARSGGTAEAFLQSDQGQVIVTDYKTNKQDRLGVSCQSLCRRGLCPMKEMANGAPTELEDCWRRCTAQAPVKLPFPVSSPKNYYTQNRRVRAARVSLGPIVL